MSREAVNLTGQRFERLVVMCRGENHITPSGSEKLIWVCKCDCGNIISVFGEALKKGNTKSCGCYRSELTIERNIDKTKDILGERFGRLVVLEHLKGGFRENSLWKCLCDCGNILSVPASSLSQGKTKSCGCLQKESVKRMGENSYINLIGEIFGRLTVVKKVSSLLLGRIAWVCQCECGRTTVVRGSSLISGDTKSCGCLSESWIASELKKYFKDYYEGIPEYKILKNPKTEYYLPYDIYLPNENVFIEIQGQQHYREVSNWHNEKNTYDDLRNRDKLKKQYANKNGTFIEIDLRKIKTVEKAIEKIEKVISESQ